MLGSNLAEDAKRVLDRLALDIADNEHKPRAMIFGRPRFEQSRWVEQVLNAVHHHRPAGPVDDVDDALYPQQIITTHRRHNIEPGGEGVPQHRGVAHNAESVNPIVMSVDVVMTGLMSVIMIVLGLMSMIVLMLMNVLHGIGLVVQPALNFDALACRII